jgi:uncharacterized protein involved in type VI secretion and phage assembly
MLKKVMLGIVAVILLVGAENLLAKEKEEQGKPKAKQKQRQVQKETKKQKSKAKRLAKKKADKQTAPKRRKASQKKRRQKVTKEAEAKKARAEKARVEKAKAAAAARKRMEQVRGKSQQLRPGANLPRQQMFGKWLDELTNAYRENDREKMGQLIRKMHQLRQRVRKAMSAPGDAVRDLRDRPRAAQPSAKKGRLEIRKAPPESIDRPSRRKPPESIDRPSAERRREGTDRRRRGSPEPKRPEP